MDHLFRMSQYLQQISTEWDGICEFGGFFFFVAQASWLIIAERCLICNLAPITMIKG